MKNILLIYSLLFLLPILGFSEIVSWDASSGLLPSDSSIDESSRFVLNGNASWLSIQNGAMNVNDNSATYQLNFKNLNYLPIGQDWAYQIELKMNSHSRPILDYGATAGITQYRRSFLGIASDKVGFVGNNEFINGQMYSIDTTNSFHVYRVIKNADIVSLYVDNFDTPVMSISYEFFPIHGYDGTDVTLTMSSNPGLANYDVKSFVYNPIGSEIPEPATLSLLTIGAFLAGRKRK